MKHSLSLLTLLLCVTLVNATTRYASPNGNDNGSTYSQPTSWSNALNATQSGDTLYLLGGQYSFSGKQTIGTNKNGTSAKKLTFIGAFPGEKPIFDFRSQPYKDEVTGSNNVGISVSDKTQYIHIKGITIRYAGKNGIINYGNYNLFENLDVYGCGDTGIQMKNGGNNTILNCDSHDNFDYKTMNGTKANFGGNADGFADKQFTGAGNHYIGCRAWGNSDDGWDFYDRKSSSQTIIENCICYQNGPATYNMKNHPRYEVDKAWFDSKVNTEIIDRYDQTITITLENYPCQGNGNGFKMGGNYSDHQILIHHCLSVANNKRGFDQNNNGGTMWVYNNTAYDNGPNYGFTTSYGTNTIQNCISYKSKSSDSYRSKTVEIIDHNSWNGFTLSNSDFVSLDTTQILAARQLDGSLPESTCLHLASGSSLIDAGVDINLGYNGNAPDLGCYETDGEHHDPIDDDTIPDIQPEGSHRVAFVTTPNAPADKALLAHLKTNDSLYVVQTEATDADVDYSDYEVIVLGSVPNSGAAGFAALKGYNKPMLLLKPFLLKASVWNWGDSDNTADLSVKVVNVNHPIFQHLTITDGELQLFSKCSTNAVTVIKTWTNTTGFELLGTPVSQETYTTIADFAPGTNCNGTILPQRLVMIGVSEYSTADLTYDGKRLIENAICYLLGIPMPTAIEQTNINPKSSATKFIHNGHIYIRVGTQIFDCTGRSL